MRNKKRITWMLAALVLAAGLFAACSLVKEGITGEKQDGQKTQAVEETPPSLPAAFSIIGDWFGVYGGSEYLSLRFTADLKCELQSAKYKSDMFGPKYYGEYRWGGDSGREIILDLYKGSSKEVDYGGGDVRDEWYDSGREGADTALQLTFEVMGSPEVKSFALKGGMAALDTTGYTVVQGGAFIVMLAQTPGGGNSSPYLFGAPPESSLPANEGKSMVCKAPDTLVSTAERYYTTAELNVRCAPGTGNATYGTVAIDLAVYKIGSMASGADDWVFVLMGDGGGWVNTDYLSATASGQPEVAATVSTPDGTALDTD